MRQLLQGYSFVSEARDIKALRLTSRTTYEGVHDRIYRLSVDAASSQPPTPLPSFLQGVQELWVAHDLDGLARMLSSLPSLRTLLCSKCHQSAFTDGFLDSWAAFVQSLPATLYRLQLPYTAFSQYGFEALVQLVQQMPQLQLALTGFVWLDERQAMLLASIDDSLHVLRGVSFRSDDAICTLFRPGTWGDGSSCMRHLCELEVVLDEDRSEERFEAVLQSSVILCNLLPSLTSLTRLIIWEYAGDVGMLIESLSQLPYLQSLGLSSLHQVYSLTDEHMRQMAVQLYRLNHLSVDRLSLMDEDAFYPNIQSLDVGFSIQSYQRLSLVLPYVTTVKVRWTWEQAIRKLAGWHSITNLTLSNVGPSVDDLVLIRTLQNLCTIKLTHGRGRELLSQLIHALGSVPSLEELAVHHWRYMSARPSSPTSGGPSVQEASGELPEPTDGGMDASTVPTSDHTKFEIPRRKLCAEGRYQDPRSLSITELSSLRVLELRDCSFDLLSEILSESLANSTTKRVNELRLGPLSLGTSSCEGERVLLIQRCVDCWDVERLVLNSCVGMDAQSLSEIMVRRPHMEVVQNPAHLERCGLWL